MDRFLPDSSCLVALVASWHVHHEETREGIERRLRGGAEAVLAAHALAEAFSVLTRLPDPHRLSPPEALEALESGWQGTRLVALTGREYWQALRSCRDLGVSGGRVYDALISACARKARANELVTWNVAHFERLASGYSVRTPPAKR